MEDSSQKRPSNVYTELVATLSYENLPIGRFLQLAAKAASTDPIALTDYREFLAAELRDASNAESRRKLTYRLEGVDAILATEIKSCVTESEVETRLAKALTAGLEMEFE
jgi:hypothetical protein